VAVVTLLFALASFASAIAYFYIWQEHPPVSLIAICESITRDDDIAITVVSDLIKGVVFLAVSLLSALAALLGKNLGMRT
jgi:hypothetical protein